MFLVLRERGGSGLRQVGVLCGGGCFGGRVARGLAGVTLARVGGRGCCLRELEFSAGRVVAVCWAGQMI